MGDTVTVACKLPNGIALRLFKPTEITEPVLGGGTRVATVNYPIPGAEVRLKGYATEFGKQPKVLVVGGYALNPGVPKDFWDEWLKQHKDTPLVTERLIYAMPNAGAAQDKAREQAEIKNGLEPLDPEKPAHGIEPSDEMKKRWKTESIKAGSI